MLHWLKTYFQWPVNVLNAPPPNFHLKTIYEQDPGPLNKMAKSLAATSDVGVAKEVIEAF